MNSPLHPRDAVDVGDGADADVGCRGNGVSVDSVGSVSSVYTGPVIHAYTRAEALADGVLVDVTEQATTGMLGGFAVPVAVTAALWSAIQAVPRSLEGIADPRGRLHDVLWMASLAVCRASSPGSHSSLSSPVRTSGQGAVPFRVILPYRGTRQRVQTLRVEVGPDDHGAPCVTIGFPEDF